VVVITGDIAASDTTTKNIYYIFKSTK